ncbi:kinase-like domain-containing protein [Mycena sanguinolenta]|nr:kinase-like domain-containing protein [Mycena sanguinolenta]
MLWIIELSFGSQFLLYRREKIVIAAIDDLIFCDPIDSATTRMKIFTGRLRNLKSNIQALFVQTRVGPISLPATTYGTFRSSEGVWKAILGWANDSSTQQTRKAMWCVINDTGRTADIARDVCRLLSESRSESAVALVDVSRTQSIFWPLISGLATASPSYRQEYARSTPRALEYTYRFPYYDPPKITRPRNFFLDPAELVQTMISQPLIRMQRRLSHIASNAIESQHRVTLVVYGVSNSLHTTELMQTIEAIDLYLPDTAKFLDILIVSHSRIFLPTAEVHLDILDRVCALHISDSWIKAPVFICSGDILASPPLCERLSSLLLNGIYRTGGDHANQIMPMLLTLVQSPEVDVVDDSSTESIFVALHTATKHRARLLQFFMGITVIEQFQIDEEIRRDNIKVARLLQTLSSSPSLKSDVTRIPREHSIAVLNLTHEVLGRGLPRNSVIVDWKAFTQRARRLLNLLSTSLQLLPDNIAISSIVVSASHPVATGGFSNIYRENLRKKFFKEVLVWRYLEHPNIVPFLGVDSTTFPNLAMAMVTPWMAQGNVISYISRNSPCSPYGMQLLHDCIAGLKYLHSVDIVHGDLRGGNILVDDDGHTRLADFGLAGFIDSETSGKSSTRSGTTRWMAPELLCPPPGASFRRTFASDIWAFGCVVCEIWTEGTEPFQDLSETALLIAFSDSTAARKIPYATKPVDKGGNPMPNTLWEVAQWCWEGHASARPTAEQTEDRVAT